MSRGIGAFVKLVLEDSETVIYEFGSYNLNDARNYNEEHICDGIITIARNCFAEPEIHEKMKKMPSGRKKLIIKRIPVHVDYNKMISDGRIVIENCSNCWECYSNRNTDIMATPILFYLFLQYQIDGKLPEYLNYNV